MAVLKVESSSDRGRFVLGHCCGHMAATKFDGGKEGDYSRCLSAYTTHT